MIAELAHADLVRGVRADTGAKAKFSADQVVRATILYQSNRWSFDELAFELAYNTGYRKFFSVVEGALGAEAAERWEAPILDAADHGDHFYAPQSEWRRELAAREGNLVIYHHLRNAGDAAREMNVYQSIGDQPQLASLLVDPRARVHATCGALPTKSLSIPPEHYADALKAIRVTFLAAPVLTERDRIQLPLPAEPGWTWSWLQREPGRWRELTPTPVVERAAFEKAFPENGREVWRELIDNGWIAPVPGAAYQAAVVPKGRRKSETFRCLPDRQQDIERVLEVSERFLGRADDDARFGPPKEIREGWLRLTPETDHES